MSSDMDRFCELAEQTEQRLLGAMLISNDLTYFAVRRLTPSGFRLLRHAIVFDSIRFVYHRDGHVDAIAVANNLQERDLLHEVGGAAALYAMLTNANCVGMKTDLETVVASRNIWRDVYGFDSHTDEGENL
jgi:replicative DNA helicase